MVLSMYIISIHSLKLTRLGLMEKVQLSLWPCWHCCNLENRPWSLKLLWKWKAVEIIWSQVLYSRYKQQQTSKETNQQQQQQQQKAAQTNGQTGRQVSKQQADKTTDKQAGRFFKKTDTETDTYRLVRGHKPMYGLRKNHPQWLWRQGRPRRWGGAQWLPHPPLLVWLLQCEVVPVHLSVHTHNEAE